MRFKDWLENKMTEEVGTATGSVGGGVTPVNGHLEPTVSKKAQASWTKSGGKGIVKRKSYQDFINGS